MTRPLHVIADEIYQDWTRVYFGAVPYLAAMRRLNAITDMYGNDPAASIVARFLVNAATWHGPTARRIKTELRGMQR